MRVGRRTPAPSSMKSNPWDAGGSYPGGRFGSGPGHRALRSNRDVVRRRGRSGEQRRRHATGSSLARRHERRAVRQERRREPERRLQYAAHRGEETAFGRTDRQFLDHRHSARSARLFRLRATKSAIETMTLIFAKELRGAIFPLRRIA